MAVESRPSRSDSAIIMSMAMPRRGDIVAMASARSEDSSFYWRLKIVLKIKILFATISTTVVKESQAS